jgi:predicted AlkP superfamily pyrophosphatase or phosphodiesterase
MAMQSWLWLVPALLLPGSALAADPLIVISMDGFRADYLDRGDTPVLAALARGGVRGAMQPSFPSLTFPNHYTLVTGRYPDHHGVVDNVMWDAGIGQRFTMSAPTASDPRWWDQARPLWITAEEHNVVTAVAGWPGSEVLLDGHRPHYLAPWRDKRTADEAVATLLNWLDLPARYRPALLLGYFYEVDHQGHVFGPRSPQVNQALRTVDAALGKLVAGLKARNLYNRANIVIVADHGMAATPPGQNTMITDLVPPSLGIVRTSGSGAGIDPLPGHDAALAARLLKPHPHFRCWRKSALPARWHYGGNRRVPQFYCLNQPGWRFRTAQDVAKKAPEMPGNHGFDPALPDMRATFVAHGPAFRTGVVLRTFPNVDVYPLLARLAGLLPQAGDGNIAPLLPGLK